MRLTFLWEIRRRVDVNDKLQEDVACDALKIGSLKTSILPSLNCAPYNTVPLQ